MHLTKRAFILGGGLACADTFLGAPSAFAGAPHFSHQIQLAARSAIDAKACPGLQVAISRDGEIEFSRAYGIANLETRSRVSTRTVFRVGSLTKQFTAATMIKLASANKLELNAPVSRYLGFMDGLPCMSLMELMHHTAGLHSDESDSAPSGHHSQIELAREIAAQSQPLDFPPGTAWLYSNANYIVLGAVIEAVTGDVLAHAYEQLVLQPLALRATAMDHADDVVSRRAKGYTLSDSETPDFENAAPIEIADAGGAGALRSNATDLCHFHSALLAGRLFGQSEINLMTAPGRLRDGRLSGANRFSAEDAAYGEVQYACGLLVSPPSELNPSLLHYGYINGFSAVLQTFLRSNMTMAVLCNGDSGPDLPFRAIRQIVLSSPTPGLR